MKAITTPDGGRLKICTRCRSIAEDLTSIRSLFSIDNTRGDGWASICRDCKSSDNARYYNRRRRLAKLTTVRIRALTGDFERV